MFSSLRQALNALGDEAVAGAREKGFNVGEIGPEIDQKLLLVVSEITEAQNELRAGHAPNETYLMGDKPEGFGIELADALIRIVQLARSQGVDIGECVEVKMAYNKTRPHLHGKRF